MCGVFGEGFNSFYDGGCQIFNMDVVLVVYCDSTLVWVKDANASSICKWFDCD